MKRLLLSPFFWICLAVAVTAVSSLAPMHRPRLPGTLHFAVFDGEAAADLERATRPFANLLGRSVRRSATFEVLDQGSIDPAQGRFDVAVIPAALVEEYDALRVLAWARPVGSTGWRTQLLGLAAPGAQPPYRRVAVGDSLLWAGGGTWRERIPDRYRPGAGGTAVSGPSPYSHREVLMALGMGRFDAAIVNSADLRRALEAGWLGSEEIDVELLETGRPWMALVAAPTLSEPAVDALRRAALNLDQYRFDPTNGPAGVVLASLAQIGIGGFAPIEPFPSLRP